MYQLRIKYQKIDQMKFVAHLELMRVMERTFRRMELPLKFSQGFNPHPKINFAAPLGVGVSSDAEYLDVELTEKIDLQKMLEESKQYLPNGISFLKAKFVEDKNSLMSIVAFSTYAVNIKTGVVDGDFLEKQIKNFLSSEEILHTKTNKRKKVVTKNIRDLILDMQLLTTFEDGVVIKMFLKTGSNGNLKPETVIEHFVELEKVTMDLKTLRIHRLELFAADKGNKPLDIFSIR